MDRIEVLSIEEGMGAKAIAEQLRKEWPPKKWEKHFAGRDFPHYRTISRICHDFRVEDSSAPWELSNRDFSPKEAQSVLHVLCCVVRRTCGRKHSFSNNEAGCLARLADTVPTLDEPGRLWLLWLLAQLYLLHESKELSTEALDAYVAFRPWESPLRWQQYKEAVDKKFVGRPPLYQTLVGRGPYLDRLDDESPPPER